MLFRNWITFFKLITARFKTTRKVCSKCPKMMIISIFIWDKFYMIWISQLLIHWYFSLILYLVIKRFIIVKNSVVKIPNFIMNHESQTVKLNCDNDYIKNKYGNKLRLLFTDTESLVYKIKTENVFEHFSKNKEMFEFTSDSARSK